ncbi:MAG: biotin/lipoyl-containing protein [Pseudomonadales bacterium]
MSNNWYLNNPLIHAQRKQANSDSSWAQQFDCADMRPLIICRGPIRKEAMDVFDEMGIHGYGILLSEKDSITYPNALAPELRKLTDPNRVHRVPDYSGATKEERVQRIKQIISIAHDNGYNSIFAGYGFMSEDEEMVKAMETAGLKFIGPCSKTQRAAGMKDEAKRTALQVDVSVTPGIDNVTSLALLKKYPDQAALKQAVADLQLEVSLEKLASDEISLEAKADLLLDASFSKGIDIISIDEMGAELQRQVVVMYQRYPENRIRLKAISGGGGKGQRILPAPTNYEGSLEERIEQAAAAAPEMGREILAEVKCNGVGDNKNVLAELNIETTRHQEIQVLGNGDWCVTMGGRDCSLQMHEQKLLEASITVEELERAIAIEEAVGQTAALVILKQDLEILIKMEAEGVRFGEAVGLDSLGTFECIVDGANHFFMEMNTRIQVEHRVTELCYALKFSNPENPDDYFVVESLVEVMVLLERHGKSLPRPVRMPRKNTSVEARLNATNQALRPHAGGVIKNWSDAIEGEIRDDQGISMHNPDTDVFMKYHLAGAYDSNIALLLTTGTDRLETYLAMAEVLRQTKITGPNLATNLEFHYGLVNWFIGQGINARPTTRFIVPYLTAVGKLKQAANNLDLGFAYAALGKAYLKSAGDDQEMAKAIRLAMSRKSTLIQRPLELLCAEPHIMSGWLSLHKTQFEVQNGQVQWHENPIKVLADTYHFLNMDYVEANPALHQIWDHDNDLLEQALAFYTELESRLDTTSWDELSTQLSGSAPDHIDGKLWQQIIASHEGFQMGCELISILPYIADQTAYFDLSVNDDLSIYIPDSLLDTELQEAMAMILVPPPVAKSDEIVAASGGMFYPRETPDTDRYVELGSHFNEGDPLYIVEVMKMFNKIYAPFSGTVTQVLVDVDGTIIKKGEPLFKIKPDIEVVEELPETIAERKRQATAGFLASNG